MARVNRAVRWRKFAGSGSSKFFMTHHILTKGSRWSRFGLHRGGIENRQRKEKTTSGNQRCSLDELARRSNRVTHPSVPLANVARPSRVRSAFHQQRNQVLCRH